MAACSAVLVVNNDIAASIKAYPVPVVDHLTVEYKSAKSEKISMAIFNAAGQAVYTNSIAVVNGQQTMNINRTANMTAGIYFLKINSDSNLYTQQLILQ